MLLPSEIFVRLTMEPPKEWMDLEKRIAQAQHKFRDLITQLWEKKYHLKLKLSTTVPGLKLWCMNGQMVVPSDEHL